MPTSPIGRIRHWGLGIACIIGLVACGAAETPAVAPSSPALQQGAAIATQSPAAAQLAATITTEPPTAVPITISPLPTTQPPTPIPKETTMPDQKPPERPKPQLEATLVPEGAAPANPPIAAPPAPVPVQTAPVEAARADLARRRAVAPDTIRVVEVRDVIWPDPGLGCPQPGMAYKQVPVDGLLIRLESGGQLFEYHSGGSKAPFLCEQPTGGDKATPISGGEGQ